ncbi:MAG: nucleotidyltransferase family protein [Beijerinckiaceae bacterium]
MKRDEALSEIASRATALKARGAASAYIFGSVVRGEATDTSDLDIFIDLVPNRKFSLIDLAGIQNFLQRELKMPVDVTTRSSLHPMLKSDIEREAVQAY